MLNLEGISKFRDSHESLGEIKFDIDEPEQNLKKKQPNNYVDPKKYKSQREEINPAKPQRMNEVHQTIDPTRGSDAIQMEEKDMDSQHMITISNISALRKSNKAKETSNQSKPPVS